MNGGEFGGRRYLKTSTVDLMHTNVLAPASRHPLHPGNPGLGFGMDFAIVQDPAAAKTSQGIQSYYWGGAFGTWFWIDPIKRHDRHRLHPEHQRLDPGTGTPPVREMSAKGRLCAMTDRSRTRVLRLYFRVPRPPAPAHAGRRRAARRLLRWPQRAYWANAAHLVAASGRNSPMPKLATAIRPRAGRLALAVPQDFDVAFNWDYDEGRATMMVSTARVSRCQWDAETRIDWTQETGRRQSRTAAEEMLPISGMAQYESCRARKNPRSAATSRAGRSASSCKRTGRADLRRQDRHPGAGRGFQVLRLHPGDRRGAPREAYKRLLEKFGVAYPMTAPLQELIDQVLRDSRWDQTYLGCRW